MPALGLWPDRIVTSLDVLDRAGDEKSVLEEVAVEYADRFHPQDRSYAGGRPTWHREVVAALEQLVADGIVEAGTGFRLTDNGRAGVAAARGRAEQEPRGIDPGAAPPDAAGGSGGDPACRGVHLRCPDGEPDQAPRRGRRPARRVDRSRAIYRIWPDFQVRRQIDASVVTVKADAAHRSFNSVGEGIVWAVIDSGIQGDHPHFRGHHTVDDPLVKDLHRTFTGTGQPTPEGALQEEDGHGTHVAGIIAGGLRLWSGQDDAVLVTENRYNVDNPREPMRQPRGVKDPRTSLAGMAPLAKLVSLKVLGGGGPLEGRVSRVIHALAYVREINASNDRLPRVHGVNLSLGYDFDPAWFACGRSPLCQEVDKLVLGGVVVVVAAGNSGFGTLNPALSTVSKFGLGMTISDPGNAERAITVGSTHRDAPHAYGVSYFSSKGPTGDGRRKPDLVAPGERIASARRPAPGRRRDRRGAPGPCGLRRGERHQHGRSARVRGRRGFPFRATGVRRVPGGGQAGPRRLRHPARPRPLLPGRGAHRPHARTAVRLSHHPPRRPP